MAATVTFCLNGMCSFRIVGIGRMMMKPSVTMLRTACAMAMLFRHTPLPVVRGLHGPQKRTVKTTVEAIRVKATK